MKFKKEKEKDELPPDMTVKMFMGIIPAGEAQVRQCRINELVYEILLDHNPVKMDELKAQIDGYQKQIDNEMSKWKKRLEESR